MDSHHTTVSLAVNSSSLKDLRCSVGCQYFAIRSFVRRLVQLQRGGILGLRASLPRMRWERASRWHALRWHAPAEASPAEASSLRAAGLGSPPACACCRSRCSDSGCIVVRCHDELRVGWVWPRRGGHPPGHHHLLLLHVRLVHELLLRQCLCREWRGVVCRPWRLHTHWQPRRQSRLHRSTAVVRRHRSRWHPTEQFMMACRSRI